MIKFCKNIVRNERKYANCLQVFLRNFFEWFGYPIIYYFLLTLTITNQRQKNSWANELNCVVYFSGSAPRLQLRKCLNRFVVFFFVSHLFLIHSNDVRTVQPLWHTVCDRVVRLAHVRSNEHAPHTVVSLSHIRVRSESICQFYAENTKALRGQPISHIL